MQIILYTKKGCGWCNEVRDFFNEKNVTFEEREVRSNESYFNELIEKSGQDRTPTLDINGVILADTDVEAVESYLQSKITV